MNIQTYFMLFITYSIIGWLIESLFVYTHTKKLTNRGFMVGPYIPIYGIGALLITILLTKYKDSLFAIFCMSIVICSLLEYFTSCIMEKLFNARWWNYSARKFNINGRICLETMLPFGIISLLLIYFFNPFFINIYQQMNPIALNIFCIILGIIFLIDYIFSFVIVNGYSKTVKGINKQTYDVTQDINEYIKELFNKKSYFSRRLVTAFPNASVVDKIKRKLIVIKEEIKEELG